MEHMNYDASELAYFQNHGEIRLDANASIWLAQELTRVRAKMYEMEFPGLDATQIFPMTNESSPWEKAFTYGMISSIGMAKIIADYSDDIPMVGLYGAYETAQIYRIADAYQYSLDEIRASQATGKQLPDRLASAAKRAIDAKLNELAYHGDGAYNIVGVLNHPNVPKIASASWTTAEIAYNEIIKALDSVNTSTKGLHTANRVVVPNSYKTLLATQLPGTGVSYRSFLVQENPGLQLVFSSQMEDLGGSYAGKKGVLVFEYDPANLAIEISQPFEQMPAVWNNFHAKIACSERSPGLVIYKPLTMALLTSV